MKKKVYLIGSLRNEEVPRIASMLRERLDINVFDDWYAAGPEADDYWQKYEQARGRSYRDALDGHAANHVFYYDKSHLDAADYGVLVLPAGKSGHLELGYMIGANKPCIIYMPQDAERWDVMYRFARCVVTNDDELVERLAAFQPQHKESECQTKTAKWTPPAFATNLYGYAKLD